MKQNVSPVKAALVTAIALVILGLIGYRVFSASGSVSEPQANPRPTDPNDPKYQPHLPPGVGAGG